LQAAADATAIYGAPAAADLQASTPTAAEQTAAALTATATTAGPLAVRQSSGRSLLADCANSDLPALPAGARYSESVDHWAKTCNIVGGFTASGEYCGAECKPGYDPGSTMVYGFFCSSGSWNPPPKFLDLTCTGVLINSINASSMLLLLFIPLDLSQQALQLLTCCSDPASSRI
jgi:hypothetical protein